MTLQPRPTNDTLHHVISSTTTISFSVHRQNMSSRPTCYDIQVMQGVCPTCNSSASLQEVETVTTRRGGIIYYVECTSDECIYAFKLLPFDVKCFLCVPLRRTHSKKITAVVTFRGEEGTWHTTHVHFTNCVPGDSVHGYPPVAQWDLQARQCSANGTK